MEACLLWLVKQILRRPIGREQRGLYSFLELRDFAQTLNKAKQGDKASLNKIISLKYIEKLSSWDQKEVFNLVKNLVSNGDNLKGIKKPKDEKDPKDPRDKKTICIYSFSSLMSLMSFLGVEHQALIGKMKEIILFIKAYNLAVSLRGLKSLRQKGF